MFIVHYELLLLYPRTENPQKTSYIQFHYDLKTTQIKILSAVKQYNFFWLELSFHMETGSHTARES